MAPTSAPLLAPHRKPRWTPTDQQKGILETVFAADSFPSFALRKQLAEQLAISGERWAAGASAGSVCAHALVPVLAAAAEDQAVARAVAHELRGWQASN